MGNPDSDPPGHVEDDNVKKPLPRENLIKTAVTFLSDKKIQNQDRNLLKRFLLKKGLTEEEATIAFQRFDSSKNESLAAEYGLSAPPVPHFAPATLPPPAPVPSLWHTVHSVVTTITSIGGIIYAIYWLWKTYIAPYLFGRKPKKKPVETWLGELEAAVGGCVADVRAVRCSLETLADQRAAELTSGVLVNRIQEVKTEINSLKAMLLSRNQFPAAPAPLASGPLSIPAWQLSAGEASHQEHERQESPEPEESPGSQGTTNGSDSSLEIVKDPNN